MWMVLRPQLPLCFRDLLPAIAGFLHEAPFHGSGESSSTPSTKSRDFYLIPDPVWSVEYDLSAPLSLDRSGI